MTDYYIKAVISNGNIGFASVEGHIVGASSVNEAIKKFRDLVLVTKGEDNHYLLVQDHRFVDIMEISKVIVSEAV
jgi:BioD-like phosphotransacetylase family protein